MYVVRVRLDKTRQAKTKTRRDKNKTRQDIRQDKTKVTVKVHVKDNVCG